MYPNILVGFVLPAPPLFVPSFLVLRLFVQALRITTFPDTITHSTPPPPSFFVNATISRISPFLPLRFLLPIPRSFIIITLLKHCTGLVYTSAPSIRHRIVTGGSIFPMYSSIIKIHSPIDPFRVRFVPTSIQYSTRRYSFSILFPSFCENRTTKTDNNRLITIHQFKSIVLLINYSNYYCWYKLSFYLLIHCVCNLL